MPKRKRQPKCRVIRLYKKKMPEIMPWLDAQSNQGQSVYMLIRMAQHLYGNKNWPDVAQTLADSKIQYKAHVNKPPVKFTASRKHDISRTYDNNHNSGDDTVTRTHNSMSRKPYINKKPQRVEHTKESNEKSTDNEDQSQNRISTSDLKDLLSN